MVPQRDVVGDEAITTLATRDEVGEVPIGAMFGVKQVGDEFGGRRKVVVADRSVYRQGAVTLFEIGRLDQGREVRGVIDVQVCKENGVELRYVRTGASELECATAATVHQNSRSAVLQHEVAAGGTPITSSSGPPEPSTSTSTPLLVQLAPDAVSGVKAAAPKFHNFKTILEYKNYCGGSQAVNLVLFYFP